MGETPGSILFFLWFKKRSGIPGESIERARSRVVRRSLDVGKIRSSILRGPIPTFSKRSIKIRNSISIRTLLAPVLWSSFLFKKGRYPRAHSDLFKKVDQKSLYFYDLSSNALANFSIIEKSATRRVFLVDFFCLIVVFVVVILEIVLVNLSFHANVNPGGQRLHGNQRGT